MGGNSKIIQHNTLLYMRNNKCTLINDLMMGMYRNTEDVSAVLLYLCFDRSPIIVARGHLIMRLLNMPDVQIQSILQVWFSSCWDKKTYNDFQKACSLVLADISNDEDNNEICIFIKHWMGTIYSKKMLSMIGFKS